MPRYKLPLSERFQQKYDVMPTGCWEWNGAFRNDGYGTIKINGRQQGAHRYSYELYVEQIPDKMLVLHTCDNRSCVNPKHLFLGSSEDNAQDALSKGRLTGELIHGGQEALHSTCMCKPCREVRGETTNKASSPEHGTVSAYTKGCRCDECRTARRNYMREYRSKPQ